VGLEISWYLRFSRTDSFEALIRKGTLGQAKNALHLEPRWSMDVDDLGEHLRVRYTRTT